MVVNECAIESQIKDSKKKSLFNNKIASFLFLEAQLKLNEVVTEGFSLRTQPIAAPIVQNFLVGEYSLYWRRFAIRYSLEIQL